LCIGEEAHASLQRGRPQVGQRYVEVMSSFVKQAMHRGEVGVYGPNTAGSSPRSTLYDEWIADVFRAVNQEVII